MDPHYEHLHKTIQDALGVLQAQRTRAATARKEAIDRLRTATIEINKLLPLRVPDDVTSGNLIAVEPVFDDKNGTATLRIRVVDLTIEFNIGQDGQMHTRALNNGEPVVLSIQPRDVAGAAPFGIERIERISITNTSDGPHCTFVARTGKDTTSSVRLVDLIAQVVESSLTEATKHATILEQTLYGHAVTPA